MLIVDPGVVLVEINCVFCTLNYIGKCISTVRSLIDICLIWFVVKHPSQQQWSCQAG